MLFYPLLFTPTYQHYLWGGRKILDQFDRRVPQGVYAESWELSDRPEGMSRVANGRLQDRTLHQLIEEESEAFLGYPATRFPLLVKILDAKEELSIQVHPNEEMAARWGGEPKSEAWYVLEAEPGCGVFAGWKRPTSAEEVRQALRQQTLPSLLQFYPAEAGEIFWIPGGMPHAIGAGCLLYEIQQNSNTTYRLYDWNRQDAQGKPRALHIEEALRVLQWQSEPQTKPHYLETAYFSLEELSLLKPLPIVFKYAVFFFQVKGKSHISTSQGEVLLQPGTTCLLPAACQSAEIKPLEQPCLCLQVRLLSSRKTE